jgi:hypothetical protein
MLRQMTVMKVMVAAMRKKAMENWRKSARGRGEKGLAGAEEVCL